MNFDPLYEYDSFANHKPTVKFQKYFAEDNFPVFRSHLHGIIEVLYIKSGKLEVNVGTETAVLETGDICFIDSYLPHMGNSRSYGLEYWALQMDLRTLKDLSEYDKRFEKFLIHELNFECFFKDDNISDILNLIQTIYDPETDMNNTILTGLICSLFGYLFRFHISDERNMRYGNKPFGEATRFINEHYAEKISISWLAEKFSFDPSYFCRKFKEIMGVSPSSYICIQRLTAAESLLAKTDLSIEIISQQCGFDSANYFIRKFKERYELSPLQYRKYCKSGASQTT